MTNHRSIGGPSGSRVSEWAAICHTSGSHGRGLRCYAEELFVRYCDKPKTELQCTAPVCRKQDRWRWQRWRLHVLILCRSGGFGKASVLEIDFDLMMNVAWLPDPEGKVSSRNFTETDGSVAPHFFTELNRHDPEPEYARGILSVMLP